MVHAGRISIHAPREGGDAAVFTVAVALTNFNPRPPRGGRRKLITAYGRTREFQSTPPARGGDPHGPQPMSTSKDFNPRPPRGGRRADRGITVHLTHFNPRPPRGGRLSGPHPELPAYAISIHAPREGGDMTYNRTADFTVTFQSTPPARGATDR